MKKKRNIIVLVSLLILSCMNGMSSFASEIKKDSTDDSVKTEVIVAPGEDEPLRDNPETIPGQWIYNNTVGKWWYRHTDGTYTSNDWEYINGKWYHFDSAGWMQTGWLYVGGKWYYLNPSTGAMVTGWRQISNNVGSYWYFFKPSGQMVTGWNEVLGYTYFFNSLGQLQDTTRRAIIVGNPTDMTNQDVSAWNKCFLHLSFKGNTISPSQIRTGCNITYSQFCTYVREIMSEAKESDITYICLTCENPEGTSNDRIVLFANGDYLTGQSLRSLLEQYAGRVVIFLDCDHSGTIINRSESYDERISVTRLEDNFISAFADDNRSGELVNSKYFVLCSCSSNGDSYHNGLPDGTFYWYANKYWMLGGGWDRLNDCSATLYADSSNPMDNIVSLHELYTYSHNALLNDQDMNDAAVSQNIVVYPKNSNFTIFSKTN